MRPSALLFLAFLVAQPAAAQNGTAAKALAAASSAEPSASTRQDDQELNLPVSLDKIRGVLQHQPALKFETLNRQPDFKVEIQERAKLEELVATLNFKAGPTPAGGIYMGEQQRVLFPSVDNPLRQPYAAFNQGELFVILLENLIGRYLGERTLTAVSNADRARAERAARDEVRRAVADFCVRQPNMGAGIQICTNPLP